MLKILIASTALIFLSAPAGADIYKCRLANGHTEISNLPCPLGSSTVTSRPDERVSEAARRQAEHEVERMRQYVEKREASQRAEEAAAREERTAAQQRSNASRPPPPAPTPQRQYASAEECLRSIEPLSLEAGQRARMEAECHSIAAPQNVYVPPTLPPPYPQHPHAHQPQNQLPTQMPIPKPEPMPSAPKIVMPPLQKP